MIDFGIAVAWHNLDQAWAFLKAWGLADGPPDERYATEGTPEWLFLQRDSQREGGAKTKNKAMRRASEKCNVVVSLDDDCYPWADIDTLPKLAEAHTLALEPQPVRMFEAVTSPPSRGTPFETLELVMPVAASMGFWQEIGDYCGPRQLVHGASMPEPMQFKPQTVFQRYFPLCAMNYAFKPNDWAPFFYLVEGVGRFDDIWMGWMWQKAAYSRGCCFNLNGPAIRHSRQSNVWKNLRTEAKLLEVSETMWAKIAMAPHSDYDTLSKIVAPFVGANDLDYVA